MDLFVFHIVLACLALAAVVDRPRHLPLPSTLPADYTYEPVTWTLPIVDKGSNYTFSGTVQDVFAKVNAARSSNGITPLEDPLEDSIRTTPRSTDVQLYERVSGSTICDAGLTGPAFTQQIEAGIKYLDSLKSQCGLGMGPGNCGRISCSYGSAIYWCNDNNHAVEYPCSHFADYAYWVVMNCTWIDSTKNLFSWGQSFDTDGFNVMVGEDSC